MSLTIALVDSGAGDFGQLRYQIADVTFDSSYPTGGEALPLISGKPSVGSISNVLGMIPLGAADATSAGVVLAYKPSTGKILAMRSGAATPAGTIASTLTVTKGAILASSELGLSADSAAATVNNNTIAATLALTSPVTSVFTGTAIAQAALAEVTNGGSLSTTTQRVMFIGV